MRTAAGATAGGVRPARPDAGTRAPARRPGDRFALALAPSGTAATLARDLVSDACGAWRLPELLAAARLVVSELVANAVEHARTDLVVVVSRRGAGLRLAVRDGDPHLPERPAGPATPTQERGRGLRIVAVSATRWGARAVAGGKEVWADLLPLERTPGAA